MTMLSILCKLLCLSPTEILFTAEPQDQTTTEGGTVRFECAYVGSFLTPSWRINTTIYEHSELPNGFEFNNDFSLILNNVPLSLNYTAFQCVVGIAFSSRAWLIVERNETASIECVTDCIETTSNLLPSPTDTPITIGINRTTTGMATLSINRVEYAWYSELHVELLFVMQQTRP